MHGRLRGKTDRYDEGFESGLEFGRQEQPLSMDAFIAKEAEIESPKAQLNKIPRWIQRIFL